MPIAIQNVSFAVNKLISTTTFKSKQTKTIRQNQNNTWYLQLWTKYFRHALDIMLKIKLRENLNLSFSLSW